MAGPTDELSRRQFVGGAAVAASVIAGGVPVRTSAQSLALRETADLITGPFYPRVRPMDRDADLTHVRGRSARAAGQIIQLSGRLLTVRGTPVADASIEVWQANAQGRYSHPSDSNNQLPLDPNFQGYAQLRTDRDGRYRFTTVKPGAYPTPRGDMRAPHIHFQIDATVDRKVTQLFFPGEPLNDQDRHLQSVRRPETLIATIDNAAGENVRGSSLLIAHWNIVLTSG